MALLASLVSAPLRARDMTGNGPRLSIAIPPFFGISPDELEEGRDVALTIASDLRDSGKFRLLDAGQYSGVAINTDSVPDFGRWRAAKAEGLVTGRLSLQPDGRLKVEFRLWNVASAQQLQGAQYVVAPDQWHRFPHLIADSIYERLIGQAARFEGRN